MPRHVIFVRMDSQTNGTKTTGISVLVHFLLNRPCIAIATDGFKVGRQIQCCIFARNVKGHEQLPESLAPFRIPRTNLFAGDFRLAGSSSKSVLDGLSTTIEHGSRRVCSPARATDAKQSSWR